MHSHLAGFSAKWITTGSHQAKLPDAEVGAKACHAAHIAGTGRLNEHQMGDQGRLWRKANRSAIVWGSGWKRGMGGVRPLTTC